MYYLKCTRKQLLSFFVMMIFVLGTMMSGQAEAKANELGIQVFVNGVTIKFGTAPINEKGIVFVPAEEIFKSVGFTYSWNKGAKKITASKDKTTITHIVGSKTFKLNNTNKKFDASSKIVNKKPYMPLQMIASAINATATWDSKKKVAKIVIKKQETTIKIGLNLELTGGVGAYGTSEANGIELAVEEINKKGINGKKIELVKRDNHSDAFDASEAALQLVNKDKVVAMIGAATSTNTLPQIDIATEKKIPLITPTGTNPMVTFQNGKVNEYVFRTCFIDPYQGKVAANFVTDELKVKKVAILTDTSSGYSEEVANSFKETAKTKGINVVAEEAYVAKDTDFKETLTHIKATNPEVVFVPGYYVETGVIIKQARELGITVPIIGGDGWDSPQIVELAGKDALNNTFFINHYFNNDPTENVQKFAFAYKEKYNAEPDPFAALGYDSVYLLADAIKRAGGADSKKIKDALATTKNLQLVSGFVTTMDNHHNPIKSAVVIEFKDGKQVFKTKVNPL